MSILWFTFSRHNLIVVLYVMDKNNPSMLYLLVFWRSLFIQKWGDRNSVQIWKTGLWEMGQDLWLDIREKSDKKKCPGVWAKSLDQGGFQKTPPLLLLDQYQSRQIHFWLQISLKLSGRKKEEISQVQIKFVIYSLFQYIMFVSVQNGAKNI